MGNHLPDMGESTVTTPPEPAPTPASPAAPTPDKGFPADTPVAEMSVEQQAAYWKHQARKHQQRAESRSDYDDLKAKAAEADRIRQERETEHEKAVREAAEKASAEARSAMAPSLVAAEFRAALAGRLTPEQRDALIEDINPSRYLKGDGTVDLDKVRKRADVLAPPSRGPKPDRSQGGAGTGTTSARDAGRAEAARRFPKTATPTS